MTTPEYEPRHRAEDQPGGIHVPHQGPPATDLTAPPIPGYPRMFLGDLDLSSGEPYPVSFEAAPGTVWQVPSDMEMEFREAPLVSVFTPSHDPRWLEDAYASLLAQTYPRWEWVVVPNGDQWRQVTRHVEHMMDRVGRNLDEPPERMVRDPRVRIVHVDRTDVDPTKIGSLKALACREARGDILVELDHDDQLTENALERIVDTFTSYPDASLVYSHTIRVLEDGVTEDPTRWDAEQGWQVARAHVRVAGQRRLYDFMETPPPHPHNVSHIWWAPNHVRAFTRAAYDTVGGYDESRAYLDDQDLMARLYQYGPFMLASDVPLYLQRTHPEQTQARADINPGIQTGTIDLYDQHIETAALAWAQRNGHACLDLGGAHGNADGRYIRVDQHPGPQVGIVHTFPTPMDEWMSATIDGNTRRAAIDEHPMIGMDSSIGVIRAVDFLEHVADKVAMLNELHRLLAPGGILLTMTPSTDGRGAFQDPTHVSYWNQNSWWYVTDPNYAAYVPELTARFHLSRLFTYWPSDWHREHDISYVCANLVAMKPGAPRMGGWSPFAEQPEPVLPTPTHGLPAGTAVYQAGELIGHLGEPTPTRPVDEFTITQPLRYR